MTLAKFPSNDSRYSLVVNAHGAITKVPGVKILVKQLLPVSELHKVDYVGVHDPEGNITVEMPYKYFVKLPQAYHDGNTRMEGLAGLCTYRDIPVRFLRPGACGALITAKGGSAETLIGQCTGVKPMQRAYVFPAVAVEEWNRVVAITEQSMASVIPEIRSKYMAPQTARCGTMVDTPVKFTDKVMHPKDAEHAFNGGLTTIVSVPAYHLPFDQKCNKKPVMNFHFSDMYGVLKYPVMNKKDIEDKCADKIPPDLAGVKRAENGKLSEAQHNVTTEEHLCSVKQTQVTFMHKAEELGDY